MNPLVSVVVITYQHVNYIKRCLDGVLMQQTNFDFEILLGEDGSTDGTREICIEYANKYPDKIRLFLRSRKDVILINGNPTGRYNFMECLKDTKGKYIALCEGDDYWTNPLKLQKQVDFLEANDDYSICFHNSVVKYVDEDKPDQLYPELSFSNIVPGKLIYGMEDLIAAPLIPTASILFRRPEKFIFPSWYKDVPSGDMALKMLICNHKKIKYFDEPWSVYLKHAGGVSTTHSGTFIHTGRIVMYLRLMQYLGGRYKQSFKQIIAFHLSKVSSLRGFSFKDLILLFSILPTIMFKKVASQIKNKF